MDTVRNLHCFYESTFGGAHASRFVWKGGAERPSEGGGEKRKRTLTPQEEAKQSDIDAKLKYLKDRAPAWQPEEDSLAAFRGKKPLTPKVIETAPPLPEAINPTKEVLDSLRAKMNKIKQKEFPERLSAKFYGPFTDRYKNIIGELGEAMLMQAITENVKESVLMETYADALIGLRSEAESNVAPNRVMKFLGEQIREYVPDAITKPFSKLTAAFAWKVPQSAGESLEADNPYLEKNTIKPKHKLQLMGALRSLDAYYLKRFLDEHEHHWYKSNHFHDTDKQFLEEVEMPFYANLCINSAIVANTQNKPAQAATVLAAAYSESLKSIFRSLLWSDDAGDRAEMVKEQETEDATEKSERVNDAGWKAAVKAIEEIITPPEAPKAPPKKP